MTDLIPRNLLSFPSIRVPVAWEDLWEDLEEMRLGLPLDRRGLSIYEDDKNVCVEADVPGVDPKNIEVTFDKGMLWIRGEAREEEKEKRKYYRKSMRSYSYCMTVPGSVDITKEPKVSYKDGVLTAMFAKSPKAAPRKIPVRTA